MKLCLSLLVLALLLCYIAALNEKPSTNPILTMCRSSDDCASGCCKHSILNENYNLYEYVYSGTCTQNAPGDTEPCSDTCQCKDGLVCSVNFLCRKCSKICMSTEVYNKLVKFISLY